MQPLAFSVPRRGEPLDDAAFRARLGSAARAKASADYSWAAATDAVSAAYEAVSRRTT
jgi:glycosyltransferase involved in cell wall biosynthesis